MDTISGPVRQCLRVCRHQHFEPEDGVGATLSSRPDNTAEIGVGPSAWASCSPGMHGCPRWRARAARAIAAGGRPTRRCFGLLLNVAL